MIPNDASSSGSDITLRDLLVHIQGIGTRIDRLEIKVDNLEIKMDKRFEAVENRLDSVEHRLGAVECEMRFVRAGIQNLDERLDTIELIPSILKHIKAR